MKKVSDLEKIFDLINDTYLFHVYADTNFCSFVPHTLQKGGSLSSAPLFHAIALPPFLTYLLLSGINSRVAYFIFYLVGQSSEFNPVQAKILQTFSAKKP